MKTLHLYLTRQMLATLGMTVFVFTFILLLGNLVKEVLQLVANHQATLGTLVKAIALLIPFVLAFSLPIGMLTASLLVFGRFSAEQELTAARASGISLMSMITPVLLLSVAVSAVCAWLNFDIAPTCRLAYNHLLYRALRDHPANALRSNESVPFRDHVVFVGRKDGTNLENVVISEYGEKGELKETILGATGNVMPDPEHQQIVLNLHTVHSMHHAGDGWEPEMDTEYATFPIKFLTNADTAMPPGPSLMTFRQLLEARDKIEHSTSAPIVGKTKAEFQAVRQQLKEMSAVTETPLLVYMNRQVAFSFACIGFTLIGIPLGIRAHRRETSVGVATAMVLMLVYYGFLVMGQAWSNHPERAPYLIVWIPDFIFQVAGAVLLWRANRGI